MTFKLKARRLWIVNFSVVNLLICAVCTVVFGLLLPIDLSNRWFLVGGVIWCVCFAFDVVSFQAGTKVTFRQYAGPLVFVARKTFVLDQLRLEVVLDDDGDSWFDNLFSMDQVSVGGAPSRPDFPCSNPYGAIAWIETNLAPQARVVHDGSTR